MKSASVVLLGLLGCAIANSLGNDNNYRQADRQFLKKQEDLLKLFINPQQPSSDPEQQRQASKFTFKNQYDNSKNPKIVLRLQSAYKQGLHPRGEVFNYYDRVHNRQAVQLFDLFYFAKDYDTFYQAACWARNNVNEGLFTYAVSVAILNRPDTQGIALPPQAEVFPYLYINTRAIQQAQFLKQQGQREGAVQSNLTNDYFDPYYSEDINLNQYFAYEQLKNPSWFGGEKYQQNGQNQNQNNGENFYYYLQQLLARYNLERQSNKLPPARPLDLNKNIYPGYNPQLQYFNGQPFPARPEHYNVYYNAEYERLRQFLNIDRRIADVVDSNQANAASGAKVQVNEENGVKVLGNIIQNNQNSVNNKFYGADSQFGYLDQCRRVVGSVIDPQNTYDIAPSVVENDNTANRDTAFYQCLARVVRYFQILKYQQKPYSKDELNFPGVSVQNVRVDKLVTYFGNAEVDLFNAVNYNQGEKPDQYKFKAQQQQLNNKPFNYEIQVESNANNNAIVRVFLASKYDSEGRPRDLEKISQSAVEIDRFTVNLKSGQNQIKRSSQQSTRFVQQQRSTRQLFRQVQQAQNGEPFYYYQNANQYPAAFPQNLILPRGQTYGQEFFLIVAVNSYQGQAQDQQGQQPQDNRAQGFPFDRVVREDNFKQVKNLHIQTVKVYRSSPQQVNNVE